MTIKFSRREWLAGITSASGLLISGSPVSAQNFMEPNVNPTAENPIRAHFNENVYGQSHKAREAIASSAKDSHKYAFLVLKYMSYITLLLHIYILYTRLF